MTEYCPVCKTPRRPGAVFCDECGHKFDDKRCPRCNSIIDNQTAFCRQCGYKVTDIPAPAANINRMPPPPQQPNVPPRQNQAYNVPNQAPMFYGPAANQMNNVPAPPKKSGKALKAIIIAAAVLVVLVGGFFLSRPLWDKAAEPAAAFVPSFTAEDKEAAPPVCTYDAPSIIRPAIYQSTDYLVYFKGSSEKEIDALVIVEVPGFTQRYEQKIKLKPQETRLKVRPPMIEGILKTLNISRESQIIVSVQDMATKDYIIQDSKPVTLLSKYDMKWESDDGSETYYENIAAWVTPESPKIKELLRNSIDQLSLWTEGAMDAIVGYQQIGDIPYTDITYYQVAAMYETMRNYYGIRYNATPISTSGKEAQQRIALPEDVIEQKSGLCIETAITLASAIEATGMHPMILILPTHAQVAVETWYQSGEYYIIETTALTEPDWNYIIGYLDQEQWAQYLEENQVTVVDMELAREDGIKPMQ